MQKEIKKILVIRLGAIGDVVHTTNTYRAIKAKYPNIQIHYLTTKTQACFLENDPDIDKVWIVDKSELCIGKSQNLAQILKKERYDLAINLQPNFKTKFLCFLANIKKRLNYQKTFKSHAVKNFFDTAKKFFKDAELPDEMTIYLGETSKKYAIEQLKNLPRPLTAFNAGGIISPRQGRTYPVEKWCELGKMINTKIGGTIILTGTKSDYEFLKPLEELDSVKSFIGKTSLEENAAIIGECDLMISGDSGPLHIATALKVPSIGLYGSMPINRTGTFGKKCTSIKGEMGCIPCNRRKCKYLKNTSKIYTPCMESIPVTSILEEVKNLTNFNGCN